MANFAVDIMREAGDDRIEAIMIGRRDSHYHFTLNDDDDDDDVDVDVDYHRLGIMSWDEAYPLLSYEYDDGYGGIDCHNIYVWTTTRVLFVACYDGATWVTSVPRNPTLEVPDFYGGG